MNGRDLGTYHVRVELRDGRGWISQWNTGRRYSHGSGHDHPLAAHPILPSWSDEDDLAQTVEYIYTEGNFSCDCNKRLFLARAYQQDEPDEDDECGDTLIIERLTLIRPDGSERVIALE